MYKQHVAFVRLGRSRGIFSLKCKSTLQRCPKKVTIIISSIFMHVHVLNSCSSILNLSKLHTNQTSRKDEQYASKPCTTFFSIPHHSTTAPKNFQKKSPHGHPKSKQIRTEIHSTHAQTACSFRQTGAVTWNLLTEMQKHSPKVS